MSNDTLLEKLVHVLREGVDDAGVGVPVYSNAEVYQTLLDLNHTVLINLLPAEADATALSDAVEGLIRDLDRRIYPIEYGASWAIQSPRRFSAQRRATPRKKRP